MSRLASLRGLVVLLTAACWLPACATTVPIRSTEPGPVAVGAARHLVVLDGAGRPGAREAVFLELARQTRRGGWFTVDDLSADGHRVELSGRRVAVRPDYPLEEDAAGLRIDVREWQASRARPAVERPGENGAPAVDLLHGNVVLRVTLFDPWGRVLLAEREYPSAASGAVGLVSPAGVIESAARAAIARFLAEVTPRSVTRGVRLDDSDEGQAAILELARAGETARAARALETYAERHPESSAAAYNLAVLLDALGERSEAIAWYDRALALGGEDFYAAARADCARRTIDATALRAVQPPAAPAR